MLFSFIQQLTNILANKHDSSHPAVDILVKMSNSLLWFRSSLRNVG